MPGACREMARPGLVLASASRSRLEMLQRAGIALEALASQVDEDEIKVSMKAEGATATEVAEALAELKAQRVSRLRPGALVVGADQMLVCESEWFDKPADLAHAEAHLCALRGKTHELPTVACVVRDGERLWHHATAPRLTMRAFSDSFMKDYLERVGDRALESVGAYQLEGPGAQLFAKVEGDFFTILGLPLLPLLAFLREHQVVAS